MRLRERPAVGRKALSPVFVSTMRKNAAVRVALIGVGGFGVQHVRGFSELALAGRVRVEALCDCSPEALRGAGRVYPEARIYTDYRELLEAEELDAAVISTPIPLHEEMALEVLQRDLFLLLEKPAVPLFSQWKRLQEADRHGRIAVAFQRVYSPSLRILKELIRDGALGSLRSLSALAAWPRTTRYYARASWAGALEWNGRPVLDGPATNALAHYVNDLMYLAGNGKGACADPESVWGELYRARRIESYDTVCLGGRFAGGVQFHAAFTHASANLMRARLRVEGSRGVVGVAEDCSLFSDDIALPVPKSSDAKTDMRREFVEFVKGERKQEMSLADARGYTLATNLMFQSSGGIHDIPSEHTERVPRDKDGDIVNIGDIGAILTEASRSFRSFSALGVPWARETRKIAVEDFSEEEVFSGGARTLAPDSAGNGNGTAARVTASDFAA